MAWAIEFLPEAAKDLRKLDRAVAARIIGTLEDRIATLDNPRAIGSALTGDHAGFWRWRIGDYRVVARIEDARITVLVVRVAHRREVYRQRPAILSPLTLFEPWFTRWGLTADGEPFTTRFGNHLLPVRHAGAQAMLKVAVHEEERQGGALMEWWDGVGAARVLARDGDALLMERLTGARSLSAMARSGEDDHATRILCRTAQALHRPRSDPLPPSLVPLDQWFVALEPAARTHGGTFETSATTARHLLASARDPVVLHGDFHHDNVLDGGELGWRVIDPKGLIGEAGFEYANLFRNPDIDIALAAGQLRRRAAIVVEKTGLDRRRLLQWVLAYAGLGAAWSLSSGDDPRPGLRIAEAAAWELAQ